MAHLFNTRRLRRRTAYRPLLHALPYGFARTNASTSQRRAALLRHPEKLALAELLRREGAHGGVGSGNSGAELSELSLRINFRLCADCHAWMSNVSVLLRRRITVREPKQAHTFDQGRCSCEAVGAKADGGGGTGVMAAPAPDRTSINAAIAACAREGRWREALRLLDGMPAMGMEPQIDSYRAAMQARAAHVGLATLPCHQQRDRLHSSCCPAPQACAAGGRLAEGFAILERVHAAGLTADSYAVHRMLIVACRDAGNASAAARAQALIDNNGLVGTALAPVATATFGGAPRRFGNGVESPAQRAALGAFARELRTRAGYAPMLRALPFGFSRSATKRQQVESLRGHAEKKALLALLADEKAAGNLSAQEKEIELKINFKACVDCHEWLKASSAVHGRRIVLREPKMAHVFEGGACSCGDQWRWEERG